MDSSRPDVQTGPVTFDLDAARQRMDGMDSLVQAMLGFFVQEVPALVEEADRAILDGEAAAVVRPVHTIKTHCMNFGIWPCAENAREVEASAKEGNIAGVREVWPDVKCCLDEAIAVIKRDHLAAG